MAEFIKGRALSEGFFFDAAKPLLDAHFPDLVYSAGLLGFGSDVLGYDDSTSTDHMWGPRFYLFLRGDDLKRCDEILRALSESLPRTYKGYSVHFSAPEPGGVGIRHMQPADAGPVSPLIFISSFDDYLDQYLGTHDLEHLTAADWLAFSEHRLLALNAGKLFVDGLQIQKRLEPVRFYPKDIWLYLIASNWSLIAEEQAFVKRCAVVGDALGSKLVCARIAERLMRLAFLYCRRYAPYSKWFGTAFAQLPIDPRIRAAIKAAVGADTIEVREAQIVLAQKLMADWHTSLGITAPVDVRVELYYDRDIQVIYADKIAGAVHDALGASPLAQLPLIGTLSEVANFTVLYDHPQHRARIQSLFALIEDSAQ